MHEIVVQLRRSGACKLAKHKVVSVSVLRMTDGVAIPPDFCDIDKIGNMLDIWLRREYAYDNRRLVRNMKAGFAGKRARTKLREKCGILTG